MSMFHNQIEGWIQQQYHTSLALFCWQCFFFLSFFFFLNILPESFPNAECAGWILLFTSFDDMPWTERMLPRKENALESSMEILL